MLPEVYCTKWVEVLDLSRRTDVELVLSEVVHWELVNQAHENIVELLRGHAGATSKLRRLGLQAPVFAEGPDELERKMTEASEALRHEVLETGGRYLPVPEIPHAQLVRRSLERRRPFDGNDRGYRDMLLWHSVLKLLRQGYTVVLISNDREAFVDPECPKEAQLPDLHPHLAAELRSIGHPRGVRLARSLQAASALVAELTSPEQAEFGRLMEVDVIAAEIVHRFVHAAEGGILEARELDSWGW